jgi:hypothetical protein
MFDGAKIAAPSLELSIVSEPALKVFAGLALRLVKSAPDPTATLVANNVTASAAVVLRGRAAMPEKRVTGSPCGSSSS